MESRRRLVAIAAIVTLGFAACGDDDESSGETRAADATTVTTAPAASPDGSATDARAEALADALDEAGLESLATLVRTVDVGDFLPPTDFTFFAPDDDALLSLDTDDLRDVLSDPEQAVTILRNHLVDERLPASALRDGTTVTSMAGEELDIATSGGTSRVGDASIVEADIEVADGVIHVIDAVLLPPGTGS